jgi:hypothetical protein
LVLYRLVRRGAKPPQISLDKARPQIRRQVNRLREDVELVGRLLATLAFGVAGGFCTTVAVSLLTLGPQWVGVLVGVFALMFIGLALIEALRARREVQRRRWRHRLELARTDAEDEAN